MKEFQGSSGLMSNMYSCLDKTLRLIFLPVMAVVAIQMVLRGLGVTWL